MRIMFPALLFLLLTVTLTQSSISKPYPPFESSQIELMVALDGQDNGRSSFPLAEKYQQRGRILVNVLDFELRHSKESSIFGLISWEVRYVDFSSGVTLEVTRSTYFTSKTLLKVKLQLLRFAASMPQGAIFLQSLRIGDKSTILTLEN